MKKTIAFLFILFCNVSLAQFNLVPNPSFEQYTICPFQPAQFTYSNVAFWNNALYLTSPDYFNSCDTSPQHNAGVPDNRFGSEPAKAGQAYVSIVTCTHNNINPSQNAYREYIETELTDSLIANVDYCIQFYVSACDSNLYVSNNIGIYFSTTIVLDSCPSGSACNLPYIPQFENPSNNNLNSRNGWTLVEGTYTATGGEKYIVIGNFRDTTSTICTYVGWSGGTIYYTALYYIDDVLITPCDSLTSISEYGFSSIKVFPNPSTGVYFIKGNQVRDERLEVFDAFGNFIKTMTSTDKVDITAQPSGFYILRATTKNKYSYYKLIKN